MLTPEYLNETATILKMTSFFHQKLEDSRMKLFLSANFNPQSIYNALSPLDGPQLRKLFNDFMKHISDKEIEYILQLYSSDNQHMTFEDFMEFITPDGQEYNFDSSMIENDQTVQEYKSLIMKLINVEVEFLRQTEPKRMIIYEKYKEDGVQFCQMVENMQQIISYEKIHDFMRRQKYQFNTTDYDNLKKRLLINHDDINRYQFIKSCPFYPFNILIKRNPKYKMLKPKQQIKIQDNHIPLLLDSPKQIQKIGSQRQVKDAQSPKANMKEQSPRNHQYPMEQYPHYEMMNENAMNIRYDGNTLTDPRWHNPQDQEEKSQRSSKSKVRQLISEPSQQRIVKPNDISQPSHQPSYYGSRRPSDKNIQQEPRRESRQVQEEIKGFSSKDYLTIQDENNSKSKSSQFEELHKPQTNLIDRFIRNEDKQQKYQITIKSPQHTPAQSKQNTNMQFYTEQQFKNQHQHQNSNQKQNELEDDQLQQFMSEPKLQKQSSDKKKIFEMVEPPLIKQQSRIQETLPNPFLIPNLLQSSIPKKTEQKLLKTIEFQGAYEPKSQSPRVPQDETQKMMPSKQELIKSQQPHKRSSKLMQDSSDITKRRSKKYIEDLSSSLALIMIKIIYQFGLVQLQKSVDVFKIFKNIPREQVRESPQFIQNYQEILNSLQETYQPYEIRKLLTITDRIQKFVPFYLDEQQKINLESTIQNIYLQNLSQLESKHKINIIDQQLSFLFSVQVDQELLAKLLEKILPVAEILTPEQLQTIQSYINQSQSDVDYSTKLLILVVKMQEFINSKEMIRKTLKLQKLIDDYEIKEEDNLEYLKSTITNIVGDQYISLQSWQCIRKIFENDQTSYFALKNNILHNFVGQNQLYQIEDKLLRSSQLYQFSNSYFNSNQQIEFSNDLQSIKRELYLKKYKYLPSYQNEFEQITLRILNNDPSLEIEQIKQRFIPFAKEDPIFEQILCLIDKRDYENSFKLIKNYENYTIYDLIAECYLISQYYHFIQRNISMMEKFIKVVEQKLTKYLNSDIDINEKMMISIKLLESLNFGFLNDIIYLAVQQYFLTICIQNNNIVDVNSDHDIFLDVFLEKYNDKKKWKEEEAKNPTLSVQTPENISFDQLIKLYQHFFKNQQGNTYFYYVIIELGLMMFKQLTQSQQSEFLYIITMLDKYFMIKNIENDISINLDQIKNDHNTLLRFLYYFVINFNNKDNIIDKLINLLDCSYLEQDYLHDVITLEYVLNIDFFMDVKLKFSNPAEREKAEESFDQIWQQRTRGLLYEDTKIYLREQKFIFQENKKLGIWNIPFIFEKYAVLTIGTKFYAGKSPCQLIDISLIKKLLRNDEFKLRIIDSREYFKKERRREKNNYLREKLKHLQKEPTERKLYYDY
ncbi:hypothetical protein pb186bvf_008179 [Paramecium bursaria]